MSNIIAKHCTIEDHKVFINGELDLEQSKDLKYGEFAKSVYKHYEIKYPKYFKMDPLSKIAFLASEVLIKDIDLSEFESNRIGVILQNSHSTYDTDSKHVDTIYDKENYFPSPAVFVYTLPNVMIGEICIKNKIQGETTCFISDKPDAEFITSYVNQLMDTNKIDICITGWVDYFKEDYHASLFLVKKNKEITEDSISFNARNFKSKLTNN